MMLTTLFAAALALQPAPILMCEEAKLRELEIRQL